jgi:hypothetical protein
MDILMFGLMFFQAAIFGKRLVSDHPGANALLAIGTNE